MREQIENENEKERAYCKRLSRSGLLYIRAKKGSEVAVDESLCRDLFLIKGHSLHSPGIECIIVRN
jgi:hypothetical protein